MDYIEEVRCAVGHAGDEIRAMKAHVFDVARGFVLKTRRQSANESVETKKSLKKLFFRGSFRKA